MSKTRFYKLTKLPLILQPDSFYFIKKNVASVTESYITDGGRNLHPIGNSEMINTLIRDGIQELSFNTVTAYRSSYEEDGYIYSGFYLNTVPTIRRYKDSVETTAIDVVYLEDSWNNRLTLTYI